MVSHSNVVLPMGSDEFTEFRDYLQVIAGIDLGENKQYLVATRLRKVFTEFNCGSLKELTAHIKQARNAQARQKVIDVMTTNETFWFRDNYPFDYLKKKILPELNASNPSGRIRIWSAACSSGQEPFSLSMIADECIRENFNIRNLSLEITATDLSNEILQRARSGIYDRLSITRGLSSERRSHFFDEVEGDLWKTKPSVSSRVSFRPLNLLDSFAGLGRFDVIFCRNVLIYFSAESKKDILCRMHGALKPGGLLFLGSSESLSGAADMFDMIHCKPGVMYQAKKL